MRRPSHGNGQFSQLPTIKPNLYGSYKRRFIRTSQMPQFIKKYPNSISTSVCTELINLFNAAHKRKATHQGLTGPTVDPKRKDSTDLSAARIPKGLRTKHAAALEQFFNSLNQCLMEYVESFPILKPPKTCPLGVFDFNIQRYYPGGQAYHAWHYESPCPPVAGRLLTWMTYLNTVRTGGETEFISQGIKISPEEGTTVVWPGGFTHAHRGLPAPEEIKFIITGWFEFDPRTMPAQSTAR